jgi:hypothetical protein
MLTNLRVDNNLWDGIRWHGPHDTYVITLDAFLNGGWGLATNTMGGVSAASVNGSKINLYGNTDGGFWNAGGIIASGLTPSGFTTGWGMYIAPTGGGSIITGANLGGGSIPLEVDGVSNMIYGQCQNNASGGPCVKVSSGYGNELRIDGPISTGFMYQIVTENANNHYFAHGAIGAGGALFDPAYPPPSTDFIDFSSNAPVPSELWQDRRQLKLTLATGTPPIFTTSTTPAVNLTAAPNIGFPSGQITNAKGFTTIHSQGAAVDTITLPAGYTYTSPDSYICVLGLVGGASNAPGWNPLSGTQFQIYGTSGLTYTVLCWGN